MLARSYCRGVWVVTIAALVVLPTQVRPQVSSSANAVPGLCSDRTDDRHLSAIRDDVLTKLSPFLPFNTSHRWSGGEESAWNGSRSVDPALLSAYEALSQVLDEEDEPTSCDRGRGTPAFAKRISLFFPVNDSVFYAPLERHQTDGENNHCKLQLLVQ
jgi:hypothetical protein